MSKIDKFLAKPVEVLIGEEKIELLPFTIDDLPTVLRMASEDIDISSKAIQQAVFKVMKQIDPECTEDQIKKVSVNYLGDVLTALGKVNNLDVENARAKLVAKLKQ